ncbi:amidase [Rhizobium sp. RAF36]|uniref:amidase n=1 Tax=Rhizobium sp. RAF36 TaxID=3233055 RepID=UPI003F962328
MRVGISGEQSNTSELLAELASGRRQVGSIVEAALSASRQSLSAVRAFSALDAEGAMGAAVRSEGRYRQGQQRALDGIPVGIKDMIDTADLPTCYGSPAYEHNVPARDAEVVRALKSNGAIVVGKTTTHEFAWGVTTSSESFGNTLNPWDQSRIPGGSSGGMAAAIAYGAVRGGLGTDTGGSVRIPAALCGVVGFKPTFGRLSAEGVFPLAPSLDHVGVMGRSVDDVACLSSALGISRGAAAAPDRFRVGVIGRLGNVPPSAEVERMFARTLDRIGAHCDLVAIEDAELFLPAFGAFAGIVLAEGGMAHFARHDLSFISSRYGRQTALRLELAASSGLREYEECMRIRRRFVEGLDRLMEPFDLLITPTSPCIAPLVGEEEVRIGEWAGSVREALMTYTAPFNLSGLPAISLPMGHSKEGLPTGLQIVAKRGRDEDLLSVAAAAEIWMEQPEAMPPGIALAP